jgi:hypothetical protein
MDVFEIKSSKDDCALEFFDRVPEDRSSPLESFNAKVTRCDLYGAVNVWAGYAKFHPGHWFRELAENWRGWEGERKWASLEGEITLSATNDRRGHVAMRVQMRSGFWDNDWHVTATVQVDPGQLDGFARHAAMFFGKEGPQA